jgi:D-alanyl-D-alanine carboxypeptidase
MMRYQNQGRAGFTVTKTIRTLLIVTAMLFLGITRSAQAEDPLPDIPYILVDTSGNMVLAANRIDERWHPASLTKLMTAYVVFRAIAAGEISLGSPVTITQNAQKTPPTKMGYPLNTQLRFDTALRILVVKSANDVAIAIAESLAGNIEAFVARMNAESVRLGLSNTNFVNPNGLHSPGQYVSARDLVVLSSAIWNEFPQYRELFETPSISDGKKIHYSYNLLLERFSGTTGMKTGFVCASGYNMVASAERDDRRLVAVVLGADSQTERAVTAARLLKVGFDQRQGQTMADLGKPANPVGPTDIRKDMCSEKARNTRYDPAPETAVINSPYLEERHTRGSPVLVNIGGIDGDPSPAWMARVFVLKQVPIPTKRPEYRLVDVDGVLIDKPPILRGSIPVPTRKPQTTTAVQ